MCGTGNAGLVAESSQTLALMSQCETLLNSQEIVSCLQAFDEAARDNTNGWQPQLALEIAFVSSTENISKNKQIESETKTSIGDLIQDEIEDSSKE